MTTIHIRRVSAACNDRRRAGVALDEELVDVVALLAVHRLEGEVVDDEHVDRPPSRRRSRAAISSGLMVRVFIAHLPRRRRSAREARRAWQTPTRLAGSARAARSRDRLRRLVP